MLEEILAYNKRFVDSKEYQFFITDKYPNKQVAVLTCMDTRLSTMLSAAMGLANGDAKIIKERRRPGLPPLWEHHAVSLGGGL